jgi:MerR family transcriptional regulator, light-induced transcriptional regulator
MDKYEEYFKNLLDGNKSACAGIVNNLLNESIDIMDLYTLYFQKSMYKIGELWEFNQISVSKEHLATAITESMMSFVYPKIFGAEHNGKKVIVSCPVNEYHQIGPKMVADVFELHGWDSYFLGANNPDDELFRLIEEKKPDLLALSLSIYFNLPALIKVIEKVKNFYPNLPIIVGGQAFNWGGSSSLNQFTAIDYIEDVKMLNSFIE